LKLDARNRLLAAPQRDTKAALVVPKSDHLILPFSTKWGHDSRE